MQGVWGASLAAVAVAVTACGQSSLPVSEPPPPPAYAPSRDVNSTNKVLILSSSIAGGLASREARAVANLSPNTQLHVATPDEWKAMTAEQFMGYRALIIGDAACQSGIAAFQAAVESRRTWGFIVDGDVVVLGTNPTSNHTPRLVENGLRYVLNSMQKHTGMYISLGCAYQDAPAPTPVVLLEPFGAFKVQGVPGCAGTGHMFGMWNDLLSRNVTDGQLAGDGCVAHSVFTTYPEHDFSYAALAMSGSGAPLPAQRTFRDFTQEPDEGTPVVGTPYILVRGAEAKSGGCGLPVETVDEQCDLGDGLNGAAAPEGQDPLETCSYSCHLNWCGDGFVDAALGEECDNGVANGREDNGAGTIGTCSLFCKLPPSTPPPAHPPQAVCKDVTVVAEYTCGVDASIDNGSYDEDGDLVNCTQTLPGPYEMGTQQVVLTCVDAQGQSGACTGMVTVVDQVRPVITLIGPADPALECQLGGAYSDPGATAEDPCDGALDVTETGSVRTGVPATYPLTYDATDMAGNQALPVQRRVAVYDSLPPVLTLGGQANMSHECGLAYSDPGATAMDQCAGALTAKVIRSGHVDTQQPGLYALRFNVTDPTGHAALELVRLVTVRDTLAPSITVNGELEDTFACGSTYMDPGASASDSCAGDVTGAIVATRTGLPTQLSSFTIAYSVTDPSGNSFTSPLVRSVTALDTEAPVLVLNGAAAQLVECADSFLDPGATAQDACFGDVTSRIVRTGEVNTEVTGGYTLSYGVMDPAGQSAPPVQRTVTVRDTLAPVVMLAGPQSLQVECGDLAFEDPGAVAQDACVGGLPTMASTAVNPQLPGSYTIVYSATDPSGNVGTSDPNRVVTVSDSLAPSLSLLGPATQQSECALPYVDPGALASDLCEGNLTGSISSTGPVNIQVPGSYTRRYSVVDSAGHLATAQRTVLVRDTVPPLLTLKGAQELSLACGAAYLEPGAEAADACAGDVSSLITVSGTVEPQVAGTYQLSYRVTDSEGNTASASRTVTVTDSAPPELLLAGSPSLTVECGSRYEERGATAHDECAGDLTDRVVRTGQVDPGEPGRYMLGYSVTDPSGRTAEARRRVQVVDTQPPLIECPEPLVVQVLEADEARLALSPAQASDDCDEAVQVSSPEQTRFGLGTTELKYTATDASGNTASCTSQLTVLALRLPDTWIISGPPGETEDTQAEFQFGASKPEVAYECSLEGRDFIECSKLTTLLSLAEGPHKLQVRARDSLGYVDPTPAEGTWVVLARPDWDRAVLGSGNGCASAGDSPSALALMGLALVLASRKRSALLSRLRGVARLAGLAVPLLGTSAAAQPQSLPTFEMERLSLNPSGAGSLVLGTGELLPDGAWRFSLTTHYENDPLVLVLNGEKLGSVVGYRATAHLAAAYGVKDVLEFGAQLPVLLSQRGDDFTERGLARPAQGPALGTPMLTARWKLLSEHRADPVDLALGLQAGPRLGRAAALARELRAIPSVMVGRRLSQSLRGAVDLGMLLRPRTVLTPDSKIQDELGYALRLGASLSTTGEGLRGEASFTGAVPLRREGYSMEALAGLRLPLSSTVETYGLAGMGYGSAPGTPDYRVLLGVAYVRLPPVCIAGGKHTAQQCPDLDDDLDGVANHDDACPDQGGRVDERGCEPRDTDNDGIEDKLDRCPLEAGVAALQGCPDEDLDGLADAMDRCPDAPGGLDHMGCPPTDTDEDGLLDEHDACPTVAGLPELDGCPPQDTDSDSLPDPVDNCPCQPGPINNEGCPETEKQLVALQNDRIAIKEMIHFEFNKTTIQARSFPLLNQVARVFLEHPNLVAMSVEGHTDDWGPADYNLDLSQRRSQAVMDYLSEHGVPRERMQAQGFGESRPLKSNATPAGRATNRRVEFMTRTATGTP